MWEGKQGGFYVTVMMAVSVAKELNSIADAAEAI